MTVDTLEGFAGIWITLFGLVALIFWLASTLSKEDHRSDRYLMICIALLILGGLGMGASLIWAWVI